MRFKKIPPRFLLPVMICVGVLMTFARVQDARLTIRTLFLSPVQAQGNEHQEAPSAAKEGGQEASSKPSKEEAPKKDEGNAPTKKASLSPESDLYKSIAGRREQLDARAKELDAREALVGIAEKRVEQKVKEMETLRAQLQTLLGQASASQAAQIENLVKIYETMKPKEAARIFESLEMPVLLNVIQRMKPARTAAVMAEMDPLRAKEITVALTKQDQLPQVK